MLVSFGRFVDKVTGELDALRLAKTVPGLRQKIGASVALCVPIAATLGVGFLAWALPQQFHSNSFGAQVALNAFLFCLGLGLGRSWFLFVTLSFVIARHAFIMERMQLSPTAFAAGALAISGLLLTMWYARFVPPAHAKFAQFWRMVGLKSEAKDALARRTGDRLPDAASWNETATHLTLGKLLKAGVYERFGHRFGMLTEAIALSVVGVYSVFGVLVVTLAAKSPGHDLRGFCESVFTREKPDQWIFIARAAFVAVTGMAGYISAALCDTTLRPNLWHPVSRRLKASAVFWSHVRQNGYFALAHLSVAFLLVAACGALTGQRPAFVVFATFLTPALACFLLAPIPQALFPRGAETFQSKTNPLVQLGAGLLGGAFCLVTVYWTSHWPIKAWHAELSPSARGALFVAAVLVVYGAYWAWVRFRFARVDLSRRTL